MKIYDTFTPYEIADHVPIQYTTCRDYDHLCRYRGLRQVVHDPQNEDERFIALETPNPFTTYTEVGFYEVPYVEENRLDIIANKLFGSAQYRWILAYFNRIEDGYTAHEGQLLMYPKNIALLFNKGEILAPINPLQLNLGTE